MHTGAVRAAESEIEPDAQGPSGAGTAHLRVLVKHGIEVATNQVCFSLLDRRAADSMSEFCLEHGVRILTFGTLAGGFFSESWLGAAEPDALADWSKMKYRRFIEAAGSWGGFPAESSATRCWRTR